VSELVIQFSIENNISINNINVYICLITISIKDFDIIKPIDVSRDLLGHCLLSVEALPRPLGYICG
jgi:hypothetical protein